MTHLNTDLQVQMRIPGSMFVNIVCILTKQTTMKTVLYDYFDYLIF